VNPSSSPTKLSPLAVALPAISVCVLWSTAFAAVQTAFKYTDSPVTLAGVRFCIAGCILIPFNGHPRNYVGFLRQSWRPVMLVSLFQTVILYGLAFWGMNMARGAQSAIMMGASPLIASVMAHFTMPGDRMTWRKIFAIALGMAGVAVISLSSKPWGDAGPSECLGLLVLLLAQFSAVTGNIVVARRKTHMPPVLLNSAQIGIGGVILVLLGLGIEGVPEVPTAPTFYAVLLWLALISAICFTVWFHLLRRVPVSRLNMWGFVTPVFGAIFSWTFLAQESPDALSIIGMVAVALAMVLSQAGPAAPVEPS
jgi:drug/metabolite transporter (DMT)-like permease